MLKAHLDGLDNEEKFPLGPIISPSPGPTLEIEVAAPEIEVTKSKPVKDNTVAKQKKIIICTYILKKKLTQSCKNYSLQYLLQNLIIWKNL